MLKLATLFFVLFQYISSKRSSNAHNPAIHGNCEFRDDGLYEIKQCHKEYTWCIGTMPDLFECEDGLVFDGKTDSCEKLEDCKKSRKNDKALYFKGKPFEDKPESKTNYNCTGKPNGLYYEIDCHRNFIRCIDGVAVLYDCGSNMVFNNVMNACLWPHNCEIWFNRNPHLVTPIDRCRMVPMGNFGFDKPCSPDYYLCLYGIMIPKKCMWDDKVFDGFYCSHKEEVKGCPEYKEKP